jgi:CheY-like chemotaxis protein
MSAFSTADAISASGASPMILVIDDSPADRRAAAALLEEKLGARVIHASDGPEGLAILVKVRPALVLTDMQMPHMDGLEVVEKTRAARPNVPVILMTADGSEDLALRALQAGAASYVPKQLFGEMLIPTAVSVIATARQERKRGRVQDCLKRIDCDYELDNDPALIPPFIHMIQDHLVRLGICADNGKIRLGVALEEALLNGLYHGNLELSSDLRQDGSNTFNRLAGERRDQPPYRDRRLHVTLRAAVPEAMFIIRDEGPGFDLAALPDPTDPENLVKASGRGLLLIRTFMDEVRHNEAGNQITMIKRVATTG